MNKDEVDSFRSKLIALIKSKHFDQAYELIKSDKRFYYEKAYILHRQGKNKEALDAIHNVSDKNDIKV
jgi:hypothetical protein